MTPFQFLEVFITSVANVFGQILLKKSGVKTISWEMFTNKFVWLGAIFYVAAFWIWIKIINEMEMTIAIPLMTGILYVLTLIAAWYFFREQVTLIKIIGVFFICLGIIFLTKK